MILSSVNIEQQLNPQCTDNVTQTPKTTRHTLGAHPPHLVQTPKQLAAMPGVTAACNPEHRKG